MKKLLLASLLSAWGFTALAQGNEWQDPEVFQVNRSPMHTSYFAYESAERAAAAEKELSENYMTLNGTWRFNWVENADARPLDFFKVDYNDRGWDNLAVPAMWELNGYGDPIYVNVGYAWRSQFQSNPPHLPAEGNHVGSYRKEITIPADWDGKEIFAHFGSVTSNIYLWVNGKMVGYSEDSKLEAEFNVTKYLKEGKNLIAFQVFRWCDGTYLEDQDFFRYSGVGRDCYLYARQKSRIEDIRVTPDLDSEYKDGSLAIELTLKGKVDVELSLTDAEGTEVASTKVSGSKSASATIEVKNPKKWSAEEPNLYTLTATAGNETIPVKVGFRKIEQANAQILINGEPVLFKGANRHELDPDGGYVVSKERMEQDIKRMKELNINAVRTCHYPDDSYFYELCDKYGIYMVAEANIESHGMGYGDKTLAKSEEYAAAHLERNVRNVQRNFNHPSIIFWSLGNEAGFGQNFIDCYNWIKAEDPSRAVQYEQARGGEYTDVYCPMYCNYANAIKFCESNPTKPLIQCEYAHAMGNSQGGFKEYWDLIRKYPSYQGGFIWDFVDQSIHWKNSDGVDIYGYGGDFNRYDASDNNFLDNGIISPDRGYNPHAYEVEYIYQSIWTELKDSSKGEIEIYNENFFRDLSAYTMQWTILADGVAVKSGLVSNLEVAPQGKSTITLGYSVEDLCPNKELLLNVSYRLKSAEQTLPAGEEVAFQQMTIKPYEFSDLALESVEQTNIDVVAPTVKDNDRFYLVVEGEKFTVEFTKQSGYISLYNVDGAELLQPGATLRPNFWRAPTDNDYGASLQKKYSKWNSPTLKLESLDYKVEGDKAIIEASYTIEEVETPLTISYEINNVGAVKVTQKMEAAEGRKESNIFRFGMKVEMPKSYNEIEFYGRGPEENYADRNNSALIGKYRQAVADQYFPYIRPQESGNKTDLRWWRVLNISGAGLEFISDAPFSASALDYTVESLDNGVKKTQRHSPEVERADFTTVCIDKVQAGLACVNSWGALPLPEYMLPYQDYEFSFIMQPVKHKLN